MTGLLDGFAAGAKRYRVGTERCASPVETWQRIVPLFRAMGITRVADVTGLDRIGIPVVMVCRPNSRSLSVFQGKGANMDAARVSGAMEAIEAWHAENVPHCLRRTRIADLVGASDAINPLCLPLSAAAHVDTSGSVLTVAGVDLASGASVEVPFDAVHVDFTRSCGSPLRIGSNGLASGNEFVEAVAHALFEVIERDATTLWNQLDVRGKQATELDISSIDDPVCVALVGRCHAAGLGLRAWQATSDIGVPTYIAELRECAAREGPRWPQPAFGSGCHVNRNVALARALAEAAQVRTTFIAGARDDMSWADYGGGDSRADVTPRLMAGRTGAAGEAPRLRFDGQPDRSPGTLRADVDWTLERLRVVGLEQVAVVDLSREAIGLPVVRVVVPGLEGPDDDFDDYLPGVRARVLPHPLQRTPGSRAGRAG